MTIAVETGLGALAARFDAVFCDLWGVVHNGRAPYPGAIACLRRLRADGRPVVLLSNAPRPSDHTRRHLAALGVPDDAYDDVITSGDITVGMLNARADAWHAALGRRFYHLGPDRSRTLLAPLADEEVGFARADYLINTGLVDDEAERVEDYEPLLRRAIARGLPMVSANPDLWVMRGERTVPCAGALSGYYRELGGDVVEHGKPHPAIFAAALAGLNGIAARRVAMLGDNLATDIRGGAQAGLFTVLIAGGVDAGALGWRDGGPIDRARLDAALAAATHRPDAVLPRLLWD